MAEEPKPRKRRGCLIAAIVAVLVLGALIAVPGILAGSRASRHRNASAALRTLASAEADFRGNDRDDNQINDYWVGDVSQLYLRKSRGEQLRLIELSTAQADGAPWAPFPDGRPKGGYRFAAIKTDETGKPYDRGQGLNPDKFAFCAYPAEYLGKAWHRSDIDRTELTFIVNEENVIWRKDLGGAPAAKWPKDPLAEGWSKLD
jgi:hypothetical protein